LTYTGDAFQDFIQQLAGDGYMLRSAPALILLAIVLAWGTQVCLGETARALALGKVPQDRRLEPLKDLNGYFPFSPAASVAEWEQRAERVRRQMLVALGLWPLPTKAPLNAVLHGRVDRDDYTVERVYFESMPGFYVTGSLYRPKGAEGKRPGVLCPHGHWANGRFYETSVEQAQKDLETGAEEFQESARSPLQARCVQLARMGCAVFHYDMLGYADSQQISFEIAHRFATQRPEMNASENWGLFSPPAEAHAQSVMGLQTYNSIRALDFLSELPDVDASRIGVTGASGGGTQTFLLCGIDPRPAVCFPAVMVSTAMQGGCTCENACNLRIGTGNVEFAALFAPKPAALTAADDWTKEMLTKGFPELLQHYSMFGAPFNVTLLSRTEFGHNYNSVSRHTMYHWFNRHLQLGAREPIQEREFQRLSQAEMTVWDDQHPRPQAGDDFERKLLRWWHDDSEQQLAALTPRDANSLGEYRHVVGGGWDAIIGRRLPAAEDVQFEQTSEEDRGNYLLLLGLLRNAPRGEELPALLLHPKQWASRVVVWLDQAGKSGLLTNDGQPQPSVQTLLDAGVSVVGVDLLYQGEFLSDGQPLQQTRRVGNNREAAAYTFGYNPTVFTQRVHDVLTVLSFVKHHELQPRRIDLVGLNGAGPWAAGASAQATDTINAAAIDTQGFRFGGVRDLHSPDFVPGGAKYGDLPGLLSVASFDKLWLAGEGDHLPSVIAAAHARANAVEVATQASPEAAVTWLLAN